MGFTPDQLPADRAASSRRRRGRGLQRLRRQLHDGSGRSGRVLRAHGGGSAVARRPGLRADAAPRFGAGSAEPAVEPVDQLGHGLEPLGDARIRTSRKCSGSTPSALPSAAITSSDGTGRLPWTRWFRYPAERPGLVGERAVGDVPFVHQALDRRPERFLAEAASAGHVRGPPTFTRRSSPVARSRTSTAPSSRLFLPAVTRTGQPIRSASANFSPARRSRSSRSTSLPRGESRCRRARRSPRRRAARRRARRTGRAPPARRCRARRGAARRRRHHPARADPVAAPEERLLAARPRRGRSRRAASSRSCRSRRCGRPRPRSGSGARRRSSGTCRPLRLAQVGEARLVVAARLDAAQMEAVAVRAGDELPLAQRLVGDHLALEADRPERPAARRRRPRGSPLPSTGATRRRSRRELHLLEAVVAAHEREHDRPVRLRHRHRLRRRRRVDAEELCERLDRRRRPASRSPRARERGRERRARAEPPARCRRRPRSRRSRT